MIAFIFDIPQKGCFDISGKKIIHPCVSNNAPGAIMSVLSAAKNTKFQITINPFKLFEIPETTTLTFLTNYSNWTRPLEPVPIATIPGGDKYQKTLTSEQKSTIVESMSKTVAVRKLGSASFHKNNEIDQSINAWHLDYSDSAEFSITFSAPGGGTDYLLLPQLNIDPIIQLLPEPKATDKVHYLLDTIRNVIDTATQEILNKADNRRIFAPFIQRTTVGKLYPNIANTFHHRSNQTVFPRAHFVFVPDSPFF